MLYIYIYIWPYICVYTWKIARHIHTNTDSVGNSRKSPENDFCLTRQQTAPVFRDEALVSCLFGLITSSMTTHKLQTTRMLWYEQQKHANITGASERLSRIHSLLGKGMLRSIQRLRCLFLRSIGQMFLNHLCITIRHCHFLKKSFWTQRTSDAKTCMCSHMRETVYIKITFV
jgi:hypothetical protein